MIQCLMKVGSTVVFDEQSYPQYKGKAGLLIKQHWDVYKGDVWEVLVDGRIHPYGIPETQMANI